MSSPGNAEKRARDEPEVDSPGEVDWTAFKAKRTEVFECKRHPRFPEYLRTIHVQMGEIRFVEWLGFGVEDPAKDVADFKEWAAEQDEGARRCQGDADNARTDLHVDLESCVLPLAGKEGMHALLTVPGVDRKFGRPLNLGGDADMLAILDQSGSMCDANAMLGEALIKMADDTKDMMDKDQLLSFVNFAYVKFGSAAEAPGFDEGDDALSFVATGYKPWMKLYDMKVAMRNIVQRDVGSNMGCTNMRAAIELGIKLLKKRREDQDLPNHYLQHLLLMTDGHPDGGQAPLLPKLIKDLIGDLSIVVHVLCLGDNTNIELAEELTEATRGVMAHAARAETLNDAFATILSPVSTSARAFTVELSDKTGKKVHHFGILTEQNQSALIKMNLGSKGSWGSHIAATVGVQGIGTPTAIVPYYAKDDDDPEWKGPWAMEPKALKEARAAETLMEEHKKKVMAKAEESTLEEAAEFSRTLTAGYATQGMGPVPLRRIRAFNNDLDAQIAIQAQAAAQHGAQPPPSLHSRMSTISSVTMSMSYSQAY